MRGERLELVTDFGSLRVGMIVVTTACGRCGGAHRCMLMPTNGLPTAERDGSTYTGAVYVMEPQPPCALPWPGRGRVVVSPGSVRRRTVYRVVDGLESPAETRRLELTR